MAQWPEAWRNNLPWAGQATANANITDIHGTILPALDGVTSTTNDIVIAQERAVEKLDCETADGDQNLFQVAGGPVIVTRLVGIVTTEIDANDTTTQIIADPTEGNEVNMSTAVDLEGAVVGTSITFTDAATPVLTPDADGAMTQLPQTDYLCPEGVIKAEINAANTAGVIAWYLVYKPLAPGAAVTPM